MRPLIETNFLTQSNKGQEETNQRLDAILAEQKRTNDLLSQLLGAASRQSSG
jgi:uncharacterized protein YwgA